MTPLNSLTSISITMKKRLKTTLYCIIAIAIIAVVWLMLWNIKTNTKKVDNVNIENITWEDINENTNTLNVEDATFEEDVMKDLEWFFNNNNWYEAVEWEYWFIDADEE